LKVDMSWPIRSWPKRFHCGFWPLTICVLLKSGAPEPEPPPNSPLEIVADP
jgi:hypothetical protein